MGPQRVEEIRRRLVETFHPVRLEIEDQSQLHAGHAGARSSGGGHYVVTIIAQSFTGKTQLERHRLVYDALRDLMARDIHALSVRAASPQEQAET